MTESCLMGKRLAYVVATAMICVSAASALAQTGPELTPASPAGPVSAPAQPASGGLGVTLRVDDMVESYSTSANSLAFLVRNIAFGYELSGSGHGVLSAQKFDVARQEVDEAITPGKEPRGIIITKGAEDQPLLRFRIAGQKKDVVVQAKFIRSDWLMLTNGRPITIIAPVGDMQVLDTLLPVIGKMVTAQVKTQLKGAPTSNIEDLAFRNSRTEGDQVIIRGNNRSFTISYPSVTATYTSDVKAAP
jgi:hypothetical protein